MKPRLIGYGRTIPDGNYGNDKYYIEVELEDWETDIPACFQKLRDAISAEQGWKAEVQDLRATCRNLESRIYDLKTKARRFEKQWENAELKWAEAIKFLESHGVKVDDTLPAKPSFNWLEDDSDDDIDVDDIPM